MELHGRLRRLPLASLMLVALLAILSLATAPSESVPSARPLLAGAQVDVGVLAILRRSCQDCHSESTSYPWYSYVAPVSFLIRSDVNSGRRHLNFSRWDEYPLQRKERCLTEIANQIKDGDMPLWQYTLVHRDARLSVADVNAVFQWTQIERSRLIAENSTGLR